MKQQSQIRNAFTANRAEELGLDVWDDFVIPLFFTDLDLATAKKARRIVGGRGSGKTMLLRYLSHQSQFSPNRKDYDDAAIENIGLYWRADTNFLTMLKKQGLEEDVWIRVFRHYLTLITSIEILKSIESIAKSKHEALSESDLESIDFSELSDFDPKAAGNYSDIVRYLKRKLRETESAIHNPTAIEKLIFLPDSFVIEGIIHCIKGSLNQFSRSSFIFYVDEYENLLLYQQKSINTKIKHGQCPLIYHVAMKSNGMETNKTLGEETIQGIADYRLIDLDNLISELSDYELFAAEIFLQRVTSAAKDSIRFDPERLKDIDRVEERLDAKYRQETLQMAKSILPGMSQNEMAESALAKPGNRSKLESEIQKALSKKADGAGFLSYELITDGFEQAAIISPVLLARENTSAQEVFAEYSKLINGEKSKFSGWLQNNFIGAYLKLYRSYNRACPFYAGFYTFTKLSRGNIRHFLELCNAAVKRWENSQEAFIIDIDTQALAVRSASEDILNEAPSYGRMGSRLRAFIYNLGHIFEYSQMRRTQSEPEVNHFSIKGGYSNLDEDDIKFLSEAEKWGVLYKEKSTKEKDKSNPDSVEWILNPVYSPFFVISYRKKRKIEFTSEQFKILHSGSSVSQTSLETSYRKRWELDGAEQPYSYSLL